MVNYLLVGVGHDDGSTVVWLVVLLQQVLSLQRRTSLDIGITSNVTLATSSTAGDARVQLLLQSQYDWQIIDF